MKLIHLSFVLSSLFLLASCGESGINGRKRITITKESISSLVSEQNFECAPINGSSCPVGIARLFIHNPKDVEDSATCSGFLNGSNKIVTNNHCVASEKECQNTYISIYTGEGYESVRCKKIIKTQVDPGALNSKGIDYTVMEIDRRLSLPTLPLSITASYLGESLSAWVVDHKTLNSARITELNCVYSKRGNSMQLNNCPVIQGNSGSPLINVYGEVVGLIWGSTTDDEVDERYPLQARRNLGEIAFATELRYFKAYLLKY